MRSFVTAGLILLAASSAESAIIVKTEMDTGAARETVSPYRYAFSQVPTLATGDLLENPGTTITQVLGTKHPASGTTAVLKDGLGAANNNNTGGNYFSDNAQVRISIDLGQAYRLTQFNTYSWHLSTRTPQFYTLYGSTTLGTPASSTGGYTLLGSVDTRTGNGTDGNPLGYADGQVGVSFQDNLGGSIGDFRYLLVIASPAGGDGGTFFSEFDVIGGPVPEPASLGALAIGAVGLLRRRR